MTFKDWLYDVYLKGNGEMLSDATVFKYINGVNTISKEMIKMKIIDKPLENMELYELDKSIENILKNSIFQEKDNQGNRMYSNSLKRFRCYKFFNTDLIQKGEKEENIISRDKNLTVTEKEALIKSRRGQGYFRNELLKKYNNKCIITGISIPEVLVASHIKPWIICDNHARVNRSNGLLLSATYDKLFDSGLITFKADGQIKLSKMINQDNRKRLNLSERKIYDIKYTEEMESFLKYHNDIIFVK